MKKFSTRLFLLATGLTIFSAAAVQAAPSPKDLDTYYKLEESASWKTGGFIKDKIKEGKDVAEWSEILALHAMRVKAQPNVIFECARTAARAQPKNLHFLVTYAWALAKLDKFEAAQEFIERVLKADPKNARGLAVQAFIWGEQGKEEDLSKELMRSAIKYEPNDPDVHYLSYHFYKKIFNFDEAMRLLGNWIKAHPNDVTARLNRVEFLRTLRRRDEALEECKKVLAINPDNEAAHYSIISIYHDMQNHKATVEAASKYLNKDRMNYGLFELWKRRADSYYHLKQYDKSIADYSTVLCILQGSTADSKFSPDLKRVDDKVSRNYLQIWCARCIALMDAGKEKRAFDDITQLLRQFPTNSGALQANIRICEKMGKYQAALNSLGVLTDKDSDIAEWHKIKVRLLRKAGREADAAAAEKRFKEVTEFGTR